MSTDPHRAFPATIGEHKVRFYASPLSRPDFPWVAHTDMMAVGEFQPDAIAEWAERHREAYPGAENTHDLPDGTMIVPDIFMLGLLQIGLDNGWDKAPALLARFKKATEAVLLMVHVEMADGDFAAFMREATLFRTPVIPGVTHVH